MEQLGLDHGGTADGAPLPQRRRGAQLRVAQRRTGGVTRAVLANGVRVVIKPDHREPVVAMRAMWAGGLRLETPETNGVTRLLSRMLVRGCGGTSADGVRARVRALAGSLAGMTGRNSAGVRAEWPAEHWAQGLDLLARCIASPDFDARTLAREQQRLLDELAARERSPALIAFRALAETLYRRHPYGMDVLGTPAVVTALDREALVSFYDRYYPIGALTLVLVGDVDAERALARVRQLLGHHVSARQPRPAPVRERFAARSARSREVYRFVDRDQAHVLIGFPGPTLDHPDRVALDVMAAVLDRRLARELRHRQALAHRVGAVSAPSIDPGHIAVHLACRPEDVPAAIAALRARLDNIAREPVSEDELARARRSVARIHEQSLERPSAVAAALAFHEAHGLDHEPYARYATAVRAVTAADVLHVAYAYLDWDLAVTVTVQPPHASPEAARRARGVKKRIPRTTRSRSARRAARDGSQ